MDRANEPGGFEGSELALEDSGSKGVHENDICPTRNAPKRLLKWSPRLGKMVEKRTRLKHEPKKRGKKPFADYRTNHEEGIKGLNTYIAVDEETAKEVGEIKRRPGHALSGNKLGVAKWEALAKGYLRHFGLETVKVVEKVVEVEVPRRRREYTRSTPAQRTAKAVRRRKQDPQEFIKEFLRELGID